MGKKVGKPNKQVHNRKRLFVAILILGIVFFIVLGVSYFLLAGIEFDDDMTVNIEPSFGAYDAPVKMYVYFDFLCPSCAFFDFTVFDNDMFSIAVGDASGHGLPAALMVRDVVTGLRMVVEKEMQMTDALQKLNRVIHRSAFSSSFASLFYGEIESNGNIFYVNAGHPPPILVYNSNINQLNSTGVILGAASEISLHRGSISIETGAILVLYSDGLLERFNDDEEDFGLSRLKTVIVQNQDKKAQEILKSNALEITSDNEEVLQQIAMTAMTGKGAEDSKEKFSTIIV